MRANIVFVLLILLLGGLAGGLVARGRMPHVTAVLTTPAPAIESDASVQGTASASTTTGTRPAPTTSDHAGEPSPPNPVAPPLDRPLGVMASSWELVAPAVMANGGVFGSDDSLFARARLDVSVSASSDTTLIENALARGGADPAGADVIVLPLPRFVAAVDRLEVLDPRIFFVVGFAAGGDVLAGPSALGAIDRDDDAVLVADAGSNAALLGLFVFDASGIPIKLAEDGEGTKGIPWRAVERRPSQTGTSPLRGRLVLSTAQASRLIPHVAVAREGFLRDHPVAAAALVESWLEGQRMVAADREGAARAIADAPGGPAMLTVLNDLGLVASIDLIDNARLMELAGRQAVTLPTLFERTWGWWSRVGSVTRSQAPTVPIDTSVVALVARRQRLLDDDEPLAADDDEAASDDVRPATQDEPVLGDPLLVQRLRGPKLDPEALTATIGWLAGIFPDAAIEVSVHPGGVADEEAAASAIARATTRYDIIRTRLVASADPGRADTVATVRVRERR